jgi:hypothetical protein
MVLCYKFNIVQVSGVALMKLMWFLYFDKKCIKQTVSGIGFLHLVQDCPSGDFVREEHVERCAQNNSDMVHWGNPMISGSGWVQFPGVLLICWCTQPKGMVTSISR